MGLSRAVSQPQRHRGTCTWTSPLLGRGLPDARALVMSHDLRMEMNMGAVMWERNLRRSGRKGGHGGRQLRGQWPAVLSCSTEVARPWLPFGRPISVGPACGVLCALSGRGHKGVLMAIFPASVCAAPFLRSSMCPVMVPMPRADLHPPPGSNAASI